MGYWCLQLAIYISELVSFFTGTVPKRKVQQMHVHILMYISGE